jgi:hypothetical protein
MTIVNEAVSRAIAVATAGDWEGAHAIVQQHEGQPMADWLHGVLHRIEGDESNASYWYNRAGRTMPAGKSPAELQAELQAIAAVLDR